MLLNNNCKFKSCGAKFPTLYSLIEHVESVHVNREPVVVNKLGDDIHLSHILPYSTLYKPKQPETFASNADQQLVTNEKSVEQQSELQCNNEMEIKGNCSSSSVEVVLTDESNDLDLWSNKCVVPNKKLKDCKKKKSKIAKTTVAPVACYCGIRCKGSRGLNQHKRLKHKDIHSTHEELMRGTDASSTTTTGNDTNKENKPSTEVTITANTYKKYIRDRVIIPDFKYMNQPDYTDPIDAFQQEQQERPADNSSQPYFNVLTDNNFLINKQ